MDREHIMDNQNREYRLGLYEKSMPNTLSWQEKLTIVKESGFDYMEISIDETDEKLARLDQSTDEIKLAIKETGVPIHSMCLSGHRKYPLGSHDIKTQERSLEIMQKAILFAADLGIRIIQLAGYDVYYEDGDTYTQKAFENNLKKCVEMASKYGVVLGFETMETPFMDTTAKAMDYVAKINSPYLGVYPDSGNITNAALLYGTDAADDLETGSGHIVAVHLKETVPGKYREIPFGTGHVDFEKIAARSWELGVRRFVAEFWYKEGSDWRQELKNANDFLRGFLDKLD